jgi:hypothetical protein
MPLPVNVALLEWKLHIVSMCTHSKHEYVKPNAADIKIGYGMKITDSERMNDKKLVLFCWSED